MRKRLLLILLSLLLVVSLVAISCGGAGPTTPTTPTPPPPEVQTLRIGFITGLTGWASVGTVHQVHGATVAVEMLNERGGLTINGQKYEIELVVEDDKSTTDGSVAATNKLIYDENIKFIGGYPLWFAAASKDICEPEKILRAIVWTCLTPGEIGPDTPYTFLCASATLEQAVAVLDYIVQAHPEVKTLACVAPDDGAIQYIWPEVMSMLEARGLSRAGDLIVYPNDMVDPSPIAAKLVAREADAILHVNGWAPHAGGILKAVRELGDERFYFGAVPCSAAEVLAICGEAAATNFSCVNPMLGVSGNPPLLEEVGARLASEYGGDLNLLALNGFDCVWVMAQAIEAAQSLDTTAVRDAWEQMDPIETVYGTGHLGGAKTYGIMHAVAKPVALQLLDNGEVKFGAWMEVHLP
ncbi:MAG: ABC transporter substrate-binding protein [Chloroflexi bacterium]|nr:ABC transporter substrate-binding protein [Chloroflexota bacterium]